MIRAGEESATAGLPRPCADAAAGENMLKSRAIRNSLDILALREEVPSRFKSATEPGRIGRVPTPERVRLRIRGGVDRVRIQNRQVSVVEPGRVKPRRSVEQQRIPSHDSFEFSAWIWNVWKGFHGLHQMTPLVSPSEGVQRCEVEGSNQRPRSTTRSATAAPCPHHAASHAGWRCNASSTARGNCAPRSPPSSRSVRRYTPTQFRRLE